MRLEQLIPLQLLMSVVSYIFMHEHIHISLLPNSFRLFLLPFIDTSCWPLPSTPTMIIDGETITSGQVLKWTGLLVGLWGAEAEFFRQFCISAATASSGIFSC